MKRGLALLIITLVCLCAYVLLTQAKNLPSSKENSAIESLEPPESPEMLLARVGAKGDSLKIMASGKGYSDCWAFLIDMSLPSGRKRFFIYDLKNDTIYQAGLVAHGNCNNGFRDTAQYSNTPGSGCSSRGRYRVGYSYEGRFGKAYKLYGLDSTNSNAFERNVVLHAYNCIPDEEGFPYHICNSLGCPMVSYKFMGILESLIDTSRKPIVLWIF